MEQPGLGEANKDVAQGRRVKDARCAS
jgi:hypothetical protein